MRSMFTKIAPGSRKATPAPPPWLVGLLGVLLTTSPASPAEGSAAPPPLKSLKLGADDGVVRIHYLLRHPTHEAWLTLQHVGGVSAAEYEVVTPIRDAPGASRTPPPVAAPLEPRVPWPAIWQEMTETGFFSLPDENATAPCETEPIPVDAPQIAVEVRQGAHQHHFGYGAPLARTCPAAVRAATTLRFLQDAFAHALPLP